jgi:hypothetical protein
LGPGLPPDHLAVSGPYALAKHRFRQTLALSLDIESFVLLFFIAQARLAS